MKPFSLLYRREFSMRTWQGLLFGLAALLSQPLLILLVDVMNGERFEAFYSRSAAPAAAALLIALSAVWMAFTVYRDFRGGLYTLFTLPCRRENVYFAKLAAYGSLLLLLFTGLLSGVFLSYPIYLSRIGAIAREGWPMENGLLLALCRGDMLRLLFPLEIFGFLSNLLLLFSLTVFVYEGVLCVRGKHIWWFLPLLAGAVLWVLTLRARIGWTYDTFPEPLYHGALLLLSGLLLWHSLHCLKQSAL